MDMTEFFISSGRTRCNYEYSFFVFHYFPSPCCRVSAPPPPHSFSFVNEIPLCSLMNQIIYFLF